MRHLNLQNMAGPNLGCRFSACSSFNLGFATNRGFWLCSHLASPNVLTLVIFTDLDFAFWTRFSLLANTCLFMSSLFQSQDWRGSWPWRLNQADGMKPNHFSHLICHHSWVRLPIQLYSFTRSSPLCQHRPPAPQALSLYSPVQILARG